MNNKVSFETGKSFLRGHCIVCPQKCVSVLPGAFCEAALRAALQDVHVLFVGPTGAAGQLEKAALKIDNMRLRPKMVYNALKIRI